VAFWRLARMPRHAYTPGIALPWVFSVCRYIGFKREAGAFVF
jgi:hypothetical protein